MPGSLGLKGEPNAVRAASGQEPLPSGIASPGKKIKSILQRPSDDRAIAASGTRPLAAGGHAGAVPRLPIARRTRGPRLRSCPRPPVPWCRCRRRRRRRCRDLAPQNADCPVHRPQDLEIFSGLVERPMASRAQELSALLHAPDLASDAGVKAVELRECLRIARPADRRDVIAAYWLARQRAAEHQLAVGTRRSGSISWTSPPATTARLRRPAPWRPSACLRPGKRSMPMSWSRRLR